MSRCARPSEARLTEARLIKAGLKSDELRWSDAATVSSDDEDNDSDASTSEPLDSPPTPPSTDSSPPASPRIPLCREYSGSSAAMELSKAEQAAEMARLRKNRRVTFDLLETTFHCITPYSEVYGIHPRLFNFSREETPPSWCFVPPPEGSENSSDQESSCEEVQAEPAEEECAQASIGDIRARLIVALNGALSTNVMSDAVASMSSTATLEALLSNLFALPAPRGPLVGDTVVIASTRWTQKRMPDAIGKKFVIKTRGEGHQPYKVEGHERTWLSEGDLEAA